MNNSNGSLVENETATTEEKPQAITIVKQESRRASQRSQKQARRKKKKDRKYFGVHVDKLAASFEKQFFSSIIEK
jgi:hypothetical protein